MQVDVRRVAFFAAVCAALGLGACGNSRLPATTAELTCNEVEAGACDGGPTFATVTPILAKSCLPACHDGSNPDGGSWPLIDYDDVADWSDVVKNDLLLCTMPPADASIRITDQARATIVTWVLCGAPP